MGCWDRTILHDTDPRTTPSYLGGNNHHIEIREDRKTGKWAGEVIPTFEAARRVRIEGNAAVDRQ